MISKNHNDIVSFGSRLTLAVLVTAVFGAVLALPLTAMAASSNSVTLTWTAPGDDGNTGRADCYEVRYSTAMITAANWAQATLAVGCPAPGNPGTTESFAVNGLTPATTYYFGIKAADEVPNWSPLSNVLSAATAPEVDAQGPNDVDNLIAFAPTTSTVTLRWTAVGDDGSVGTAAVYDIRYATVPITEANWNSATQATGEPSPRIAGTIEYYTVTGLSEGTAYFFALKVADEVPFWSGLSNVVTATTAVSGDTDDPGRVATLTALNPTTNGVTLQWTATGDDGSTGTATMYDIRYSKSVITEANWNAATRSSGEPSPKAAGSLENFVVSGLESESSYYFALKVGDEVPNWSVLSNVTGTTTPDGTPGAAIATLAAAPASSIGALTLTWTATGDDGQSGTASDYVIKFSITPINDGNWGACTELSSFLTPAPQQSGTEQSCDLTGLTPGQTYYVAIKTIDESGNISSLSNIASGVAQWNFSLDIDDEEETLPTEFALAQNYPNPFNPSTVISFSAPEACHASLVVYNVRGQAVKTLLDGPVAPGKREIEWNGLSDYGSQAASGVYFYRLIAGDFSQSQKMVMLK